MKKYILTTLLVSGAIFFGFSQKKSSASKEQKPLFESSTLGGLNFRWLDQL
jgi:hypothetical protein